MKRYALFDFDGTITIKDTLFDFIRFTYGRTGLIKCLLFNSWNLFLYAIKMRSNEKAKERLLSTMIKGSGLGDFERLCERYATERIPMIVRKETMGIIERHITAGDTLFIVSASPEDWIKPWAIKNGFANVIATRLEKRDGVITGKFASRNCYGEEKVNRLKEIFTNREQVYLCAYGDSNGDKPMFNYSDKGSFIQDI